MNSRVQGRSRPIAKSATAVPAPNRSTGNNQRPPRKNLSDARDQKLKALHEEQARKTKAIEDKINNARIRAENRKWTGRANSGPSNGSRLLSSGRDSPSNASRLQTQGRDSPSNASRSQMQGLDSPSNASRFQSQGFDSPSNQKRLQSQESVGPIAPPRAKTQNQRPLNYTPKSLPPRPSDISPYSTSNYQPPANISRATLPIFNFDPRHELDSAGTSQLIYPGESGLFTDELDKFLQSNNISQREDTS